MKFDDGAPPHGVDMTTARLDEFAFSEKVPLRRVDEYEIDFNDARDFFTGRWLDILTMATERLSAAGN
jgi:hypothetical protein